MSLHASPAQMFAIPENAPFSGPQRAWLSGFLAAMLESGLAEAQGGAPAPENAAPPGPALASNDDAPWHDPAMALAGRLDLASARPPAQKLMAAMAQQDCGQCGYTCADYANAIFLKSEARLNLCAPGGKETARAVKALAEAPDAHSAALAPAAAAPAPASPAAAPGFSREAPALATLAGRYRLNTDASEKDTWHIDIALPEGGPAYEPGDSLGIFPLNDLGLVDQTIAMLGAAHNTPVRGRTLREVLTDEAALGPAPDTLFALFSYITGGRQRDKANELARGGDPDGDAATLDVLAALHKFPGARPHPEAFVDALEPLQPRLYSISSSPRATPGRVSLTVDAVRYVIGKRRRSGVASTFLAARAADRQPLRVYVQKSHGFKLPADPLTKAIMVGPGTGVAPFRSFLLDRQAEQAKGGNWLFFGHQRMDTDFFYRDEFEAMRRAGHLTRLSLAWSRGGPQKHYVQDRMREVGADLWQWLAQGAHVYVCGDAKRMAKDVEAALVDITAQHGARTREEAISFVGALKKAGRYQQDVY